MTALSTTNVTPSSRVRRQWRAADHDQRRRLIVDTALDLLDRGGLRAVTMRRVADRLGVGAMTLYTYIAGQDELRAAMVERGFDTLAAGCRAASTLGTPQGWRGGAKHYLQFAIDHPRLYELMFRHSLPTKDAGQNLMRDGIQPLFDRIRQLTQQQGVTGEALDRHVRAAAGRYWIALHGLASLAIAQRLGVLDASLDQLLDDLLSRVAPT